MLRLGMDSRKTWILEIRRDSSGFVSVLKAIGKEMAVVIFAGGAGGVLW